MNTIYGLALVGVIGFWTWVVAGCLKEQRRNK